MTLPKMIWDFHNDYYFLSNFYPCRVVYEGFEYLSTEAAFQAAKTLDAAQRMPFREMTAAESKRAGKLIPLRANWDIVRNQIMEDILKIKFSTWEHLNKKLIETKGTYLIEGNWWNDNYWGFCFCDKCKGIPKTNMLGQLLMKVRDK